MVCVSSSVTQGIERVNKSESMTEGSMQLMAGLSILSPLAQSTLPLMIPLLSFAITAQIHIIPHLSTVLSAFLFILSVPSCQGLVSHSD